MSYINIALIGRPNVGKSTLFNRLTIEDKAIVNDSLGVTRDRKYAKARLGEHEFNIIDTPGLVETQDNTMENSMMKQTTSAIKEADIIFFVVDNIAGITPMDEFFATEIRKYSNKNKNFILLINKSEKEFYENKYHYKLGFGEPIAISAQHGTGMLDLYERLSLCIEKINEEKNNIIDDDHSEKNKNKIIHISLVGRPNAGKSTLTNSILKYERSVVSNIAGTTRDSVSTLITHKQNKIKLIDTAGLRKKSNVDNILELESNKNAINNINYSNVVILLTDALTPIEKQDLTIANYVIKEGRALIIAVNKWDLVKDKIEYKSHLERIMSQKLPQIKDIPILYISALNDKHTEIILDKAIELYKIWSSRIGTKAINDWLNFALEQHPLPIDRKLGRRVRIKYATQIKSSPPTFKFFTTNPKAITQQYKQYLTQSLGKNFELSTVPIRIYLTKSSNPYENKN